MKDCNLGDYLMYNCELVQCIAVNPGLKEVVLQHVHQSVCDKCGLPLQREVCVIVGSPNFQDSAQPIQTITIE